MVLSHRLEGEVTVVDIDGGPDGGSLLVDLVEQILAGGARRIVLNLRGHMVDSNALGQATRCGIKANGKGGTLVIATRQLKVWDVIRLLRLDRVIHCYRSEAEALDSFKA